MSDLNLWKCVCGQENSANFCINCGKKREDGEVIEKKDDAPVVVASSIAAAASVGKVDIPDELKANIQKQAEPAQPVFQPQPYQQPQMQQPYQPMVQQPQQQTFVPQTQQPVQPQYQQQYQMQQPQYQQQYQPQYSAPSQTGNTVEEDEMAKRMKISNRFSLISLICHLSYFLGIFVVGGIEYALEAGGSTDTSVAMQIISTIVGTAFTASIVFMIIARVKCKKATFAKVLMIVYIVEIALLVIIVVLFILLVFYAIITCGL